MAQRALVLLSGLGKGKVFPLSAERVTIGRSDECGVMLDDTDVSREHAALVREGAEYRLQDLQSRNGTRINGLRIQDKLLTPGDRIQFGLVEARYEASQPAVAKTVAVAPLPQVVPPPPTPARPAPTLPPAPPVAAPPSPAVPVVIPAATEPTRETTALKEQVAVLTRQNEQLMATVTTARAEAERNLTSLRTDLQSSQTELARTREQAGRVAELSRELQELRSRLADLDATSAQFQQAQARLAEVERLNRELGARIAAQQDREQEAGRQSETELARLREQLAGMQRERENVRRQLAQAVQPQQRNQDLVEQLAAVRRELAQVRQPVTEPTVVAVDKTAPAEAVARPAAGERAQEFERVQAALREASTQFEQLGDTAGDGRNWAEEKQNAMARLKALQARLTETEPLDDQRALIALRRVKEDLARVRTDWRQVGVEMIPGQTTPGGRTATGKRRAYPRLVWAGSAIILVLGIALVLTNRERRPSTPVEVAVASPPAPAPRREEAQERYTDPEGRFTCDVPRGWTIEAHTDETRSRVKFVSGNDEIRVMSYGADWPPLRDQDLSEAEKTIASMLRLDIEGGEYAQVLERRLREVEGVAALQLRLKLAVGAAEWQLCVLLFRNRGREHLVTLYVRSPEQEEYLHVVFDQFLAGFVSLAAQPPEQTVSAPPVS